MEEKWILDNLKTKKLIELDETVIDWETGMYTPIDNFLDMFGDSIKNAIEEGKDVRQSIADDDNDRGYAKYVLN